VIDRPMVRLLVRIQVLRNQIRRKQAELSDRRRMKTHFGAALVDPVDVQRREKELAEREAELAELELQYDSQRDALKGQ
jgi:hypothetical protein